MKKKIVIFLLAVLTCAFVFGAGSVDFTRTPLVDGINGLHRMELDWTSDASGNVSGSTTPIYGYLLRVSFIPDSGDTQPDNLYDLELQDSDDIDLLNGAGSNLSQSTSTTLVPIISGDSIPVVIGDVELVGSNCGASNGGTVVLYWQEP